MNGSITLVSGNLGGGKTLYVATKICEHLVKGGTVYTNIEMKEDGLKDYFLERKLEYNPKALYFIQDSEVSEFHRHVARGTSDLQVLVAIDEAAMEFNSRDWAKLNKELFQFCLLARKLDIDLYYIAQKPEFLDKQLRALCATQIDCRNIKKITLLSGLISLPFGFLARVYYRMEGGKAIKDYSELVGKDKEIFKCYSSDALLGNHASKFCSVGTAEKIALKKVEKEKGKSLWPELIVVMLVVLFL